jgi:hypothetical protein
MGHQAQAQSARQLHTRWSRKYLAILCLIAVVLVCLASVTTRPKAASIKRVNAPSEDQQALNIVSEDAVGYEAHPLTLQSPKYNLKVLRSILQHSNTSWQTSPKEAQGYFVQSLIWMQMVRSALLFLSTPQFADLQM